MKKFLETGLREFARWTACGCIVVAAHAAVPAWLMMAGVDDDANAAAGAIVVELAPMMAAPANDKMDLPPGPDQVQSDASVAVQAEKLKERPEETEEPKAEETEVKIDETVKSEIEIESAKPKPAPEKPAPQDNQVFSPVTTAIQLSRADDVPTPVAPQQTVYTEDDSDRIPEWRRQVSNKLERNKRYPASARSRGEQGTTYIEFKLDREGRVIESRVVRSSGSATLDQETLELLHRSEPFPKPPLTSLKGATVFLAIPLHYKMR